MNFNSTFFRIIIPILTKNDDYLTKSNLRYKIKHFSNPEVEIQQNDIHNEEQISVKIKHR